MRFCLFQREMRTWFIRSALWCSCWILAGTYGFSQTDEKPNLSYRLFMESCDYERAIGLAKYELARTGYERFPNQKAEVLKDLGYIYGEMGNFLLAADYLLQAVNLLIDAPSADLNLLALCHNELAFSYDMIGYFNRCIHHYEKAYEIWSNNFFDDHGHMTTILNNLRYADIQYGDIKKSRFYLDKLSEYNAYLTAVLSDEPKTLLRYRVSLLFNKVVFFSEIKEADNAIDAWNELKTLYPSVKSNGITGLQGYFLTSLVSVAGMPRRMGDYEAADAN